MEPVVGVAHNCRLPFSQLAKGVVYVGGGSFNRSMYALNAATGALIWKYTTGSAVFPSPATANGVMYIGSHDDNVYALNDGTGALTWQYRTGGYVPSSPVVVNGVVYVGSYDGNLYAFHLPNL